MVEIVFSQVSDGTTADAYSSIITFLSFGWLVLGFSGLMYTCAPALVLVPELVCFLYTYDKNDGAAALT